MSTWNNVEDPKALLRRHVDGIEHVDSQATIDEWLMRRRHQRGQKADGLSWSTLGTNAQILARLANAHGFHVLYLKPRDNLRYFTDLADAGLAASTRYHHFVVIRNFFRQVTKEKEPPQLGDFEVQRPRDKELDARDLLTAEDMEKILDICQGSGEKAFAMELYDAGARQGEARSSDYQHVTVDQDDGQMRIWLPKSKTYPHEALAFSSAPFIGEWMADHPLVGRTEGAFPLYVHLAKSGEWKRVDANWVAYLFRRFNNNAGLDKHIWPHLLRHTAATNYARLGVQEASMRTQFGWVKGSSMPSHYSHLAAVDDKVNILRAHGVQTVKVRPVGMQMRECDHCGMKNRPDAILCKDPRCGRPVSPDAVRAAREAKRKQTQDELAFMVAKQVKEQLAAQIKATVD